MVVDTALSSDEVDRLFRALADATRRDIVVRAAIGDLSVSALARNYDMSVTAVQKHVSVLESAGLVRKHRSGREQLVRPQPRALDTAREVLDEIEQLWRDRINLFGEVLAAQLTEGETR
ncbi:MAG: winged helix-turn-helix domain-containing protein [Acidimicrobiia bacterium]|nr:winged helix-turn-helix domain-containing protein [Acidimicrobiia bacterium]